MCNPCNFHVTVTIPYDQYYLSHNFHNWCAVHLKFSAHQTKRYFSFHKLYNIVATMTLLTQMQLNPVPSTLA